MPNSRQDSSVSALQRCGEAARVTDLKAFARTRAVCTYTGQAARWLYIRRRRA
ncbi:MAG: hypothetical protein OXC83_11020 [Chloroflexi bacterium]|nr:hypothetical protein [Chloroflexota bacterium]